MKKSLFLVCVLIAGTGLILLLNKRKKEAQPNVPRAESSEAAERGFTYYQQQKCNVCHGMEGQGEPGPNLTDNFWISGAKASEILRSIIDGAPERAMPSYRDKLTEEQARDIVEWIATIQGNSPADAKAPQGFGKKFEYDFANALK